MGKPLISDAHLRSMHTASLRLKAAKQALLKDESITRAERFAINRYPIALLVGTVLLLRPGDAIVSQGRNLLLDALLAEPLLPGIRKSACPVHTSPGTAAATALVAAGFAMHQKSTARAGAESGVTVAILERSDDLSEVFALAQEQLLPLLIVTRGENSALTRARARRSLVPAIPVDDTDAVAVCRVMQESLIRARNGWSSVVLHALHPGETADPILALEAHLRRRRLLRESLPSGTRAAAASA